MSWASVETEISYRSRGSSLESEITIVEAACAAADVNPLGEVTDGFIVLEDRLVEGTLDTDKPLQECTP